MGDAQPGERLPWLEPYREPARSRPAAPAAPLVRAKRSPATTALLGLLLVGAVGVGSFLIGREFADREQPVEEAAGQSVTIPIARVEPIPMPDVATVEAAPPPTKQETLLPAPAKAVASTPRQKPASAKAPRRAPVEKPPPPPPPPPKPRAMVQMSPPPVAASPGRVIDLGRYVSPRYADAAYATTIRRYPYLSGLTKVVSPTAAAPGRPRLYKLQLGARSAREARQLCRNLLKIGRPCAVV